MMTAPSTIRPKSSAPRLIRLALMRPCQHADGGHQHRDRNHQRRDQGRPEIAEQHEQHRDRRAGRLRPRLRATVPMVASTSWVRSSTVSTSTPGGSDRPIAAAWRGPPRTPSGCWRRSASRPCRQQPHGRFRWRCRCGVSPPIDTVAMSRITHRHAAAGGDDDRAEFLDGLEAAAGAHHKTFAVAFDVACAAADIVASRSPWRRRRR